MGRVARAVAAAALMFCLAAWAGCGGEPVRVAGTPVAVSGGEVRFVTSTPGPRPTLRPTFTVAPTSTPTRVPTAVPVPTATAVPTATPLPVAEPEPMEGTEATAELEATAEPEPTVAPPAPPGSTVVVGGRELVVPGTRIELGGERGYLEVELTALFPYQYEEPPRFLTHGDVAWPGGEHFISRGTRFVYWAIKVDTANAVGEWSMPVYFRWVDDELYGRDGTIMLEAPSVIQAGSPTIYQGVGRPTPGFWQQGEYTVYLLDGNFAEIMSHSFRVR